MCPNQMIFRKFDCPAKDRPAPGDQDGRGDQYVSIFVKVYYHSYEILFLMLNAEVTFELKNYYILSRKKP